MKKTDISIHALFLTEETVIARLKAMGVDLRFWADWREAKLIEPNAQGLFEREQIDSLIVSINSPHIKGAQAVRRDALMYDKQRRSQNE